MLTATGRVSHRKMTLELYLFGAGHVGSALVRSLRDLPINIHWIDTRDDMLPEEPPVRVNAICTDTPEAEVDAAPAAVISW